MHWTIWNWMAQAEKLRNSPIEAIRSEFPSMANPKPIMLQGKVISKVCLLVTI